MSDIRSRMSTFQPITGMPPTSRSPATHHPVSPSLVGAARENYTTSTPGICRHTHSPRPVTDYATKTSFYSTPRTIDPSINSTSPPSNASYLSSGSAMALDTTSSYSNSDAPPFEKTKILYSITTADNHQIAVDIQAKIDKGFFQVGSEWTCYRRNYFSVACSFTLRPNPQAALFLHTHRETPEPIHAFYICISAIQDGEIGKPMGLVQHTPKRVKDETSKPANVKVLPHPTGVLSSYTGSSQSYRIDPPFSGQQPPHQALFERIQFEKATANNGKRRAAQQYYNLMVELYADVRPSPTSPERLIKIASRQSAPMIVRGRSPGHYKDRTRDSSSSMGPDGSGPTGGDSHTGNGLPPSANSSAQARPSISFSDVSGSRIGAGSYHSPGGQENSRSASMSVPSSASSASYDTAPGSHVPVESILTAEEEAAIEDTPGYVYYPSPLYEEARQGGPLEGRMQLPPPHSATSDTAILRVGASAAPTTYSHISSPDTRSQITDIRRRDSHASPQINHHRQLPSFGSPWSYGSVGSNSSNRGCGRFQGVDSSRGYYPEIAPTAL